jgi:hypothetical protein
LAAILLAATVVAVPACEMVFKLADSGGTVRRILPGASIALNKGAAYTLQVDFTEDHRNCKVEPEETLFLLDDAKWKAGKAGQGLALKGPIEWTVNSRTFNTSEIGFTAHTAGSYNLRIIRECPKAGYDEAFIFVVR